MERRDGR